MQHYLEYIRGPPNAPTYDPSGGELLPTVLYFLRSQAALIPPRTAPSERRDEQRAGADGGAERDPDAMN